MNNLYSSLDVKEVVKRKDFLKYWVAFDLSIMKTQIKNALLQILTSTIPNTRHTCLPITLNIYMIEISP